MLASKELEDKITTLERDAWQSFCNVVHDFLGRKQSKQVWRLCRNFTTNILQAWMQGVTENALLAFSLGFFQAKSDRCERRAWWMFSPRNPGNGEEVSRKMGWGHDGRLCMDLDPRWYTNAQKELPFKCQLLIIWLLTVYTIQRKLQVLFTLWVFQVLLCWCRTISLKVLTYQVAFLQKTVNVNTSQKKCHFSEKLKSQITQKRLTLRKN